jgi:hypothetical protein
VKKRWLLVALLVLIPAIALARPGGGDTYNGGGGHGGGGGGGSGDVFELIYYLVRLVIEVPEIGIPLAAIVIGYLISAAYRRAKDRDWDSGPPAQLQKAVEATALRDIDPDFSQVAFEDFANRLFSAAHRARPDKLATVAPYVSEAARTALAGRGTEAIVQVVVGALRVYRIDTGADRVRIGVEFEANLATATTTTYSVESWLFGRDAKQTSKPPTTNKLFPCPNCGAPWQAKDTGSQVCASCGQVVDNGRFDWVVVQASLDSVDERPPTLTENPPERGTDLPTYRQPGVDTKWSELAGGDPALSHDTFNKRVAMIYGGLNDAYAKNQLEPVRGLVSDGLFDYLQYWVDAYKRQGLRNQLTNMRITRQQLAKVTRDTYYDAVTVRIWATGLDFVVNTETGKLVRGSKHRERPYSEYWTFVRSAARKGPPRSEPVCSNCGAPLKITMAGTCDHCGAHVTAGEFDWVLSKIEQDDTYRG